MLQQCVCLGTLKSSSGAVCIECLHEVIAHDHIH